MDMSMKSLIKVLMILLLTGFSAVTAQITVTAGNAADASPGDSVIIPIDLGSFNGVASFTLKLNFDATEVEGGRALNINPAVAQDLVVTINQGQIIMDWLGLEAIDLGDAQLLDLKLKYTGTAGDGRTELAFDASSIVSDELGDPLQTDYTDGYIDPYPILLTSPNGGEVWQAGSTKDITFEVYQISNIDIGHSTDNGATWIPVVQNLSTASGSYSWLVPETVSQQNLIGVINSANSQYLDLSDAVFTITESPTINLTAPNGGEEWLIGSQQNITWSSSLIDNVLIEYSTNNGQNWSTIAQDVSASSGTYQWTVTSPATDQALVRVSDQSNANTSDVSESVFSIIAPSVMVLNPNGGEVLVVGSAYEITWNSVGVSTVDIDYSTDGGQSFTAIAAGLNAGSGSYTWMVPDALSENAFIKITDAADQQLSDTSDEAFVIDYIHLSLTGGDSILPDADITSSLNVENLLGVGAITIKINFDPQVYNYISYTNLNQSLPGATINAVNGVLTVSWDALSGTSIAAGKIADFNFKYLGTPATGEAALAFDQQLTDITDISGNPLTADFADAAFTPFPLLVTAPDGGEIWQVGTSQTITWEAYNLTSFKIEYSTNSGSNWTTIEDAFQTTNFGYSWTIPNTLTDQALIKISSSSDTQIYDESDADFTIAAASAISLISPNGGEVWAVGSVHPVTWNSVSVENVDLDYSTDNGMNWISVAQSLPAGTGTYQWTVPNTPTASALVSITDSSNPDVKDISAANFSIAEPYVNFDPVVNFSTLVPGSTKEIKWTSFGISSFDLELFTQENGWSYLVQASTDSSYVFVVEESMITDNALLRISNSPAHDISEEYGPFTIEPIGLTLSSLEDVKPGDTINVPLLADNLIGAGALTLNINYDAELFEFSGYENLNENFSGVLINGQGGTVTIAWDDLAGATMPPGTFVELKFIFTGTPADGSRLITFNTQNSEITDILGNPLLVTFENSTINPYPLLLLAPNGGEVLQSGSVYTLSWENFGVFPVEFDYSTNGGADWINIIFPTDKANSREWLVPQVLTQNARIRVRNSDNSNYFDISDNSFTITASGAISLTTPNGGEEWLSGSMQDILWQSGGVTNIKIEYSTNSGQSWQTVIESTPAAGGSYSWSLPQIVTSAARVRLTDVDNLSTTDESESDFTITLPYVLVLAPTSADTLYPDDIFQIKWKQLGVANINIDYSTDLGNSWISVAASVPASPASYNWTVPNTPTVQGKVRVSETGNSALNYHVSETFVINEQLIHTVIAGNVSGVPGTQVIVPISVENFNEVGAVTLVINYDTSKLLFVEAQNINPLLDGALINDVNGVLTLAWDAVESVSLGNSLMFDGVFDYYGGTAAINLNETATEIANEIGEVYELNLIDGEVSSSVSQYVNIIYPDGGETLFAGSLVNIQWISGQVTTLNIELSTDNGDSWSPIANSVTASNNSYEWTVPLISGSENLIRLTDSQNPSITSVSESVFTITIQPEIMVTRPNGGELFVGNTMEQITWSSIGVDSVDIQLSTNNGSEWVNIAQGVPAIDQSYNWTVTAMNTDQALVRIVSADDPQINDTSDAVFSIVATLELTVTAAEVVANPGENVTVPITVDNFNNIGAFTIVINYNEDVLDWVSAENWNPLFDGALANGGDGKVTLAWDDVNGASLLAGLLVDLHFDYAGGTTVLDFNEDMSEIVDVNVSVLEPMYVNGSVSTELEEYLVVLRPNGGEIFGGNTNEEIKWLSNGIQSIKIEYSSDAGDSWNSIVTGVSPLSGTYLWTVPSIQTSEALIKLTAEESPTISDVSDAPFQITPGASVAVTAPNGGEIWNANTMQSVEWSAEGISVFDIDYSTDGGGTWIEVVGDYDPAKSNSRNVNSGVSKSKKTKGGNGIQSSTMLYSYSWLVPDTQTPDAFIKVSSSTNPSISDQSDAAFTIGEVLPPLFSLEDKTAEFGDSIVFPLNVSNMFNVGAITLTINFDPTVLKWGRALNWDPAFDGALANAVNGKLVIAWDDINGASLGMGVLTELKFQYVSGYSALTFDPDQSEIADILGQPLSVNYDNGSVNSLPPGSTYLISPSDGATGVSVNPELVWGKALRAIDYRLMVATDNQFQNIFTDVLVQDTLYTVAGLSGNQTYYWRVKVINTGGESEWTDPRNFTTLETIGFANLQSPGNASIYTGNSIDVKARVFANGITTGQGQGAGIEVWVGYNSSNTNPSGWNNWIIAAYDADFSDQDEYTASLGSDIPNGTWFYASRFRLNNSEYVYGGYSTDGGGFWNGNSNVSGILNISYEPIAAPSDLFAVATQPGDVELQWIDNSSNESGFIIERKDGDSLFVAPYIIIDSVAANTIHYTDTTVAPSSFYTYRLQAYNADTVSAYSNQAIVEIPIPVELVSFNGSVEGFNINIAWSTATETNNKGFDLERKTNGNWEKLIFIEGMGSTTRQSEYSYRDNFSDFSYKGIVSYRLRQINYDGTYEYLNIIEVDVDFTPKEFSLAQNYPNPFNPATTVKFSLPEQSRVRLTIYNALGQIVGTLVNEVMEQGYYSIIWNANEAASGMYIYSFSAEGLSTGKKYSSVKKMILLR